MRHAKVIRGGLIALGLMGAFPAAGCHDRRATSTEPSAPPAASREGAVVAEPEPAAASSGVTQADFEAAVRGDDPQAVDRLIAKLPRFADDEGHEYLIFEGDLPATEEEVRAAIQAERTKRREQLVRGPQPELKLEIFSPGKRTYWGHDERKLTYAVDKASFASAPPGTYEAVVGNMAQAAAQWEAMCPSCGLTIRRKPELDTAVDRTKVTFVVRYSNDVTSDIALAFFPASPSDQRTLWVFARYPVTSFDKVGVFRHELGHVLGYAHEHLDQLSACAKSSDQWLPITGYNPKSVMHYVCGGGGDPKLAFTDCDTKGHQRVYGAPPGVTPTTTPPIQCEGVTA